MLWNDTTEKRTLAEEWGLLWRGVKLLNKMMPHFLAVSDALHDRGNGQEQMRI